MRWNKLSTKANEFRWSISQTIKMSNPCMPSKLIMILSMPLKIWCSLSATTSATGFCYGNWEKWGEKTQSLTRCVVTLLHIYGHCLIAWPKVCRSKELGGLGISGLKSLGWALRDDCGCKRQILQNHGRLSQFRKRKTNLRGTRCYFIKRK